MQGYQIGLKSKTCLYKECGPDEGTVDEFKVEMSQGFAFRTILIEMMCAYVTCRPDIGYTI